MSSLGVSSKIGVVAVLVLLVAVGVAYFVLAPSSGGTLTSTSRSTLTTTSSSSSLPPSSSSPTSTLISSASSTTSFTTSPVGAVLCTNNQSATGTVTITIRDYHFKPRNVTISAGQSVQWLYSPDGNTEHTVTSNQGLFGSNNLPPGQKFTYTFNQAGTYGYHCSNHPAVMKGIVVVD